MKAGALDMPTVRTKQPSPEPVEARPRGARRKTAVGLAVVVTLSGVLGVAGWRLFDRGSDRLIFEGYGTTPLAADAPVDPDSGAIIDHMQAHSETDFIRLAGAIEDHAEG